MQAFGFWATRSLTDNATRLLCSSCDVTGLSLSLGLNLFINVRNPCILDMMVVLRILLFFLYDDYLDPVLIVGHDS